MRESFKLKRFDKKLLMDFLRPFRDFLVGHRALAWPHQASRPQPETVLLRRLPRQGGRS